MKLLAKTSLLYFILTIPIVIIGGYFCYSMITDSVKENGDEELWREKLNAESIIIKNDTLTKFNFGTSYIYDIKYIHQRPFPEKFRFSDFILFDKEEEENLPYRNLKSIYLSKHGLYLISISKASIESDDLIESIMVAMSMLLCFILIGIFLINWLITRKIWKPFYKTLEQLKSFQLNSTTTPNFDKVNTKEFNELNKLLNEMTQVLLDDYKSQKQFTENASHEIQTPLAVIQSKIELLIQSNKLGKEESELIEVIYNSSAKLSHLNKTLLLLTKIENNQFNKDQNTNLKSSIEECLNNLSEFYATKQITVETNLVNTQIQIPKMLVDILISNLIQNAIKHNVENGKIKIELSSNQLIISNTGNKIVGETDKIFDRFTKYSTNSDSIGLGLSIVKSICEINKFKIDYNYLQAMHTFSITFKV